MRWPEQYSFSSRCAFCWEYRVEAKAATFNTLDEFIAAYPAITLKVRNEMENRHLVFNFPVPVAEFFFLFRHSKSLTVRSN
jgi:hypothetical protein